MFRRTCTIVVIALAAAACSGSDSGLSLDEDGNPVVDPGDCLVVDVAVSSEKIELLSQLAADFVESDLSETDDGECIAPIVQSKASGGAAQLLDRGWDEATEGPRPVIWSPASSAWVTVLNQRYETSGREPIANDSTPFMLTPLVIAMPRPMAEALGWPDEPLGWGDVLELARSE